MIELAEYPTYANYTERFADYVANEAKRMGLEGNEEFEVVLSSVMPASILSMPEDDGGNSFASRLYARYCTREIGQETEELFRIALYNASLIAYSLYANKIKQYKQRFETAADSKEKFNRKVNAGQSENTVANYMNPANDQADILTGKTKSTSAPVISTEEWDEHVSAASHTTLLREQMELRVVYEDAVAYFDRIFMQVY